MTLVDRYLGAVKDNLPRAQRDDIIEELEDSLRSRIEDEAAARGRPLTEAEEAAILKGFGNPMAVAARYRGDERRSRSAPAHRARALPDLLDGPRRQRRDHAGDRRGHPDPRRHDRLGVPGDPRAARHPVQDRDRDLRLHRPTLGPRPRRLGSTNRLVDRSDVDVSTLDGLADQLIGPSQGPRRCHDLGPRNRRHRGRADRRWCRPAGKDRLHRPGSGWRNVTGGTRSCSSFDHPARDAGAPDVDAVPGRSPARVDLAVVVVGSCRSRSAAGSSWPILSTATSDRSDVVDRINRIMRVSSLAIVITAVSAALELRRFRQIASPV